MKLSIVVTLYYSAAFIPEFYTRVAAAAKTITNDYEIIFVNDGSPDSSKEVVLQLQAKDARIVLLDLSRNFGHHKAIMTGLCYATGNVVFLIDADLEEEPEALTFLWKELQEAAGVDVVYGVQQRRKGTAFERQAGSLYYRLLQAFTSQAYPANTLTARLMTRQYVDGLKAFGEAEFDIWTLFLLNGFEQKAVPLPKGSKGSSTYTLKRKLKMATTVITTLSTAPLYGIAVAGAVFFFTSLLYVVWLVCRFAAQLPISTASVAVAAVWFTGGLLLLCLGIISLYLRTLYIEVKKRPVSIIKKIYKAE